MSRKAAAPPTAAHSPDAHGLFKGGRRAGFAGGAIAPPLEYHGRNLKTNSVALLRVAVTTRPANGKGSSRGFTAFSSLALSGPPPSPSRPHRLRARRRRPIATILRATQGLAIECHGFIDRGLRHLLTIPPVAP